MSDLGDLLEMFDVPSLRRPRKRGAKKRLACKRGHEFTDATTKIRHVWIKGRPYLSRECLVCCDERRSSNGKSDPAQPSRAGDCRTGDA